MADEGETKLAEGEELTNGAANGKAHDDEEAALGEEVEEHFLSSINWDDVADTRAGYLAAAAYQCDMGTAQYLMETKADVNAGLIYVDRRDNAMLRGVTPLHLATLRGDAGKHMIEFLLENGADPNLKITMDDENLEDIQEADCADITANLSQMVVGKDGRFNPPKPKKCTIM
eukprot:gnl/TRDRNA2_/TRDRNA2_60856_c0_seq1.p1 gnl/TRDRNA2_/TRDRNA2_60856_c0~~gnl/TRDRNA2_/TRDRNA2_60856_c0_seq1.p1  ORF type:complete len:173 (-),score=39.39 gnl/TRDRNA2_/TRDRNA2_60856_c0_seq1:100-618(-)